jgi:glycosyltransferase involved in cell wall biosynthesis
MIFLDVTSACQSALNTGVKRIQRGLHASLRDRPDYLPVCWQAAHRAYRRLDSTDLTTLEGTTAQPHGLALFDFFAPALLRDRLHFARDRASLLDWPRAWSKDDTLLVPDLVWDNRGAFFVHRPANSARCIGVFHDAIALRRPRQSRIDRRLCRRGIRSLANFDGVLAISGEAQADLLHFWHEENVPSVPTQVTPWPVPFTGPRPASTPNFAARQLLYVARLEPHKNHLRLLDACELLWREGLSFSLRLIGCMAYPDTAWKILRRVRALRRAGRAIQWQAHVDEPELHAAYRDCSATVFPSLIEGFGLPIIESLWHGRPVVCGNNGALGELTRAGGCETVDTSDPAGIAAGLRLLLTDESRYHDLFAQTQARPFRTWPDYWSEVAPFLAAPPRA